ncbi:phage tail tube protein [Ramlibacter sp. AN1015]|uniref:phage tail tube protein n=1 Tax=Ramlibacter sp. AN1015 TaxID=3133428 RepID=UPI0030C17EE7
MPQAQGSKRQLAYIVETTYGVTPATPQTKLLDFVNFTGDLNAPEVESQTIRPNRQSTGSRRGNTSTAGDLTLELTPDNADELLEAALQGTWAANVLKVGSTQRSFSIEEGFTDMPQFRVFTGSVFNTLSMELNTEGYVNATLGFMGKTTTPFSGTSICGTPTAPSAKEAFYHEGGVFKEGGSTVGFLSALSFELSNNVTANNALGVTGVRAMTSGKAVVTGTVTALFEDVSFYNKFVNNASSSLEFTITSGAESLTFKFSKLKYTQADIQSDGDAGVTVQMTFRAEYDAADDTTMMITRV